VTAAVLPEINNYDLTVYQIQLSDPVQGYNPANPNTAANQGLSNQAALNLANRTNWLYNTINSILDGGVVPTGLAPLLSPEFEGTPTAPTAPLGDNSLKLSTTAFVQGTLAGVLALSVAGGTNVALSAVQAGNGILNFTGGLTANIAVILPSTSGKWIVANNTTGAFSLTVKTAAGTGVAVTQGKFVEIFGDGTNVYLATNDFSNIQLTGVSTSTTPPVGDQTTKIATTAFAYQLKNGVIPVPVGGGANVALTPAQYGNGILLLQGALTAAIEVIIPAQGGQYVVANETTGAFGLTMGCGGAGTTATIPQGQSVIVYCDGTNTVLAGAASSSSFAIHTFTATAAQTTFACSYTPGNILVIQNGSTLGATDFTATDGANVVLATGAKVGDGVQVIAFASFTVANAVTTSGATMIGPMNLVGGDTGVTAAQFDATTKLSTNAFVQRALGNFSNQPQYNTSQVLSPAQAGNLIVAYGTATMGFTLPLTSTVPLGAAYYFWSNNTNASGVTIACSGSDVFQVNSGTSTAIAIRSGDSFFIAKGGNGQWIAFGGTLQLGSSSPFAASVTANGYQKLPSGLILQWGVSSSMVAGGFVSVTFPLAFPTTVLTGGAFTPMSSGTTSTPTAVGVNYTGKTGFTLIAQGPGAVGATPWFALGY